MFEKDMHIGVLLDFYGDILTERQREMLDYYYNDDMSLSEISDTVRISRQGVRSGIKKGTEILIDLESKLGLAKRFQRVQTQISDISIELKQLRTSLENPQTIEKINIIIAQLQNLEEI